MSGKNNVSKKEDYTHNLFKLLQDADIDIQDTVGDEVERARIKSREHYNNIVVKLAKDILEKPTVRGDPAQIGRKRAAELAIRSIYNVTNARDRVMSLMSESAKARQLKLIPELQAPRDFDWLVNSLTTSYADVDSSDEEDLFFVEEEEEARSNLGDTEGGGSRKRRTRRKTKK